MHGKRMTFGLAREGRDDVQRFICQERPESRFNLRV